MQENFKVCLKWGQFQTFKGVELGDVIVDLTEKMPKTSIARDQNKQQLVSGHLRIDLLRPMTKGNLILLKGSRNVGKTSVSVSAIRQFLSQNPNAKAVYVGMNAKGKEVQQRVNSDRLMCIGVTDDSSASYYLAP